MTPSLALIGVGHWGRNLARNFHALGCLHTICDRSPALLDANRLLYPQTRFTDDYDSVLADPAITRVAIAAPATLHHTLAKAALLAGPARGRELLVHGGVLVLDGGAVDVVEAAPPAARAA